MKTIIIKRKLLAVLIAIINCFALPVNAQSTFGWAKQIGGTSSNLGYAITTDATGNVYSTGYFGGFADFNPGPGVNTMSSNGNTDIYISKLDASGNFVWSKQFGGTNTDIGKGIVVDASGNVITIGTFRGSVDFDPGPGTFSLSSSSTFDSDVFISKLDAAGNFIWAKRIGSVSTDDDGKGVSVDASGNVYITGGFQGTVDFDPGAGVFNLTSAGSYDIFITQLTATGNFVWAKQIGGTGVDIGNAVKVSSTGDVHTTGVFGNAAPVDFDPGAGVFNLSFGGLFVSSLDNSGNFLMAKQMLGGSASGNSIDVDMAGNIYIGGYNPGVFISKINSSGTLLWSRNPGGSAGSNSCMGISLDGSGNVYTTGYFRNTVDFSGVGICNLTSAGLEDFFVCKYDTYGNFACGGKTGLGASDVSYGIAIDATGNSYTTGQFQLTVDFDQSVGTFTLASSALDIFICKLGSGCASIALSPSYTNIKCNGDATGSATVIANGGTGSFTYSWSTTPTQTTSIASGLTIGTYTCFVNDGVSPTATVTFNITQPPVLNANAGTNTAICNGTCSTVNGSSSGGSFPHTYGWMPGSISTASSTVCPSVTTIYTLTVTDNNGCIKTAVKTVTVNALPTLTIGSTSNSVCIGSSLTLTGLGANTYTWSTSATTNSILISPASNTLYVLTGRDLNNCTNTTTTNITVNALPTVSISGTGTVCSGSPLNLTGSGANTYSWSTGATTASIAVSPTINTTYTITGTDLNGCKGIATKSINVTPLPTVSISAVNAICLGGSVSLTASGANTYTWNTSATTLTISDTPTVNTTYSVNGIDINGCSNFAVKTVTVNPLPIINITSSASLICTGQTATLSASGANTYTWNTAATTQSIATSPTVTTTYTVTGTDSNGCSDTTSFIQNVSACTGIAAQVVQANEAIAFPNPFTGKITVSSVLNYTSVEIYNALGELVYKSNLETKDYIEIDLSNQSNGIYYLKTFSTDEKSLIKKIIKQ
jgi:hypothetical protein